MNSRTIRAPHSSRVTHAPRQTGGRNPFHPPIPAGNFLLLIGGGPLQLIQGGGLILGGAAPQDALFLISGGPLELVSGGDLLLIGS